MMSNRIFTVVLYAACLMLLSLTVSSCLDDDNSDCFYPYGLIVEGFDADGNKVGSQDVKDVTLYIFDKNDKFIDQLVVTVDERVMLDYPEAGNLKIIGWGNIEGGAYTRPSLVHGSPMSGNFLQLTKTESVNGNDIVASPNDLFYGQKEVVNILGVTPSSDIKMPVYRKASSMTVTIRNLKEYVNAYDDDYSIVVRETYNTLDFYGRLTGNKAGYLPVGSFNSKSEYIVPVFNAYPSHSAGDLAIDIYHRGMHVATVIKDSEGKSFRLEEGRLLNVLIVFPKVVTGDISVIMMFTSWDEVVIWKDEF